MESQTHHIETLVLHAGSHRRDPSTNSVAVPIYQTTSYQFDNTEHAGKLFALEELGNIYTRIMNPTTQVLEERLAALEGGAAALCVSSGSSAVALAIQNVAAAGDNVIVSPHLYGGTFNLFTNTLPKMGLKSALPIRPMLRALPSSAMSGLRLFWGNASEPKACSFSNCRGC